MSTSVRLRKAAKDGSMRWTPAQKAQTASQELPLKSPSHNQPIRVSVKTFLTPLMGRREKVKKKVATEKIRLFMSSGEIA